MITSNYQVDGDIYSYADKFFCDSHDDKPSNADARDGLINGAILEETDTGKTYIFDKKANQWTEKAAGGGGGGGGGSTTLAGLTDVDISNPSDGQTLVYNSTSGKWENRISGLVVRDIEADGHVTLDKTYAEIAAAAPFVVRLEDNNGSARYEWIWDIGPGSEPYAYMLTIGDTYVATSENDYPEKLNS